MLSKQIMRKCEIVQENKELELMIFAEEIALGYIMMMLFFVFYYTIKMYVELYDGIEVTDEYRKMLFDYVAINDANILLACLIHLVAVHIIRINDIRVSYNIYTPRLTEVLVEQISDVDNPRELLKVISYNTQLNKKYSYGVRGLVLNIISIQCIIYNFVILAFTIANVVIPIYITALLICISSAIIVFNKYHHYMHHFKLLYSNFID